MKKVAFLLTSILFIATNLFAQMKVANYSIGKRGTDKFEHFDFWTNNGKRTEISYVYGKDKKEIKLQYLGKDTVNGETCFKVQFPNKYILYIIQKGLKLRVVDSTGNYDKTFSWEYEGPINGIGTHCDVCAEDETDALKLIQLAYLM